MFFKKNPKEKEGQASVAVASTDSTVEDPPEEMQNEYNDFRQLRRKEGAQALIQKLEADMAYASVERSTLKTVCQQANTRKFNAVCVMPYFVRSCISYLGRDSHVSLVAEISYPIGADVTETKVLAVKKAISDGATEVEIAYPVHAVKDGNWNYVKKQFKKIKKAAKNHNVRLLIETSYSGRPELNRLVMTALDCGIQWFTLSDTTSDSGVSNELVRAISTIVKDKGFVKVCHASDRDGMSHLLDAGAQYIGSKDAVNLADQIITATE